MGQRPQVVGSAEQVPHEAKADDAEQIFRPASAADDLAGMSRPSSARPFRPILTTSSKKACRTGSRTCCSNTTNARTRDRADDPRTVSARSDALGRAEPARLCHFAERQCRPRRRSGAGDVAARDGEYRFVPARHQHVGVAVHDPAQPVPLRVSQAPARGRGHRRQLCGYAQVASGAAWPDRVRGIPQGAVATAARPARGADPGRRVRLLLRGSRRRSAPARSAPSRAASTARARGCPSCWRSTAPTTSARTSRPAPCCRPADAADARRPSDHRRKKNARLAPGFFVSTAIVAVTARSATGRGPVRRSPR